MSFYELAASRYSERRFATTPVEEEKLIHILQAGALAPTAHNAQPQRILVVSTAEGLAKMDRCTDCRFGAPAVLILAYDLKAAMHHPDVVDFGIMDISIVATHMMLAAEELGVHSCWVGLIDPSALRREFKIPLRYRVVSVMDLGYPAEKSHPSHLHSERKPLSETVFFDTWD